MKKTFSVLLTVVIFVSCFSAGLTAFANGTIVLTGSYGQSEARSMLSMINDFRTGSDAWYLNEDNSTKTRCSNLEKLVYDYDLERIAMQRAAEIAVSFSHTRPNGELCFSLFSNDYFAKGENIAAGYPDAESVFVGWREDDEDFNGQGHRRNMLSGKFSAVGIGHFVYEGYHYWVQEFGNPAIDTTEKAPNNSETTVSVEALDEFIPSHEHLFKEVVTKATMTKDGKIVPTCSCGETKEATVIPKASNVTISASSFVYNGSVRKPALSVKSESGEISSSNYTVKWSNASSKLPGSYTVTVSFKGYYSGTKTFEYKIVPRQVSGLKAAGVTKTSIGLSWTKLSEAKYYKVEQSADGKTWTKAAVVSTNSATVKGLKAGTKYQFRVKALDSTKKIAGKTSAVIKTGTLTAAPKISKLISAKAKTATVSWSKVTGAKSYIVMKSTDGKRFSKVVTTAKLTATLSKLTGGKKIYVKIIAVNAFGAKSAASAVKSVSVRK